MSEENSTETSSNNAFSNINDDLTKSSFNEAKSNVTNQVNNNNSTTSLNTGNSSVTNSNSGYSSEVNSLFSKLENESMSMNQSFTNESSVQSSSNLNSQSNVNQSNQTDISTTNIQSNSTNSQSSINNRPGVNANNSLNRNNGAPYSSSDDNYLNKISNNASSANVYFDKINSISSNIMESSASISSISNKLNILNSRIGLNRLTIPNNESINRAAQSVAINIIKVNNQKIKALTAKNSISGMSFRIKFDYDNYLRAKKAIETDVTGINSHMSNSNVAFNQGINTLNSHNSLITSYANQLSFDADNASKGVDSASTAAASAAENQTSASISYNHVHSLADYLNRKITSTAKSNATVANLIASQAVGLNRSANNYCDQITSISRKYSNDASIASASNVATSNLQTINSNSQLINSTASSTISEINQMGTNHDVVSLGDDYQHASKAANATSAYKNIIVSAISNIASATSVAKSAAASLHARQIALDNGANDYMPISNMKPLSTDDNTATYIKYYKQGYEDAKQGFRDHLHKVLSDDTNINKKNTSSYRIGFENADKFIKGVNDSRKRIIKDDKEVSSKHYNYGYESCRRLINRSSLSKSKNVVITLKQAVLLVLGYLIGSYN